MAWARPRSGATQDRCTRVGEWLSWELLMRHAIRSAITTNCPQPFLFRIREGRCSYYINGIGCLIARDKTFTESCIHGAVCGARLVCKAIEVCLDERFLEVLARIPGHDFLTHLRRKLIETTS